VALFLEVISVDLSFPSVELPCLPPRMASKQEQQLPMVAFVVFWRWALFLFLGVRCGGFGGWSEVVGGRVAEGGGGMEG
jgi:hypothetical protein